MWCHAAWRCRWAWRSWVSHVVKGISRGGLFRGRSDSWSHLLLFYLLNDGSRTLANFQCWLQRKRNTLTFWVQSFTDRLNDSFFFTPAAFHIECTDLLTSDVVIGPAWTWWRTPHSLPSPAIVVKILKYLHNSGKRREWRVWCVPSCVWISKNETMNVKVQRHFAEE